VGDAPKRGAAGRGGGSVGVIQVLCALVIISYYAYLAYGIWALYNAPTFWTDRSSLWRSQPRPALVAMAWNLILPTALLPIGSLTLLVARRASRTWSRVLSLIALSAFTGAVCWALSRYASFAFAALPGAARTAIGAATFGGALLGLAFLSISAVYVLRVPRPHPLVLVALGCVGYWLGLAAPLVAAAALIWLWLRARRERSRIGNWDPATPPPGPVEQAHQPDAMSAS
jgi:hypothetical protein